jgi:hypothetical protein
MNADGKFDTEVNPELSDEMARLEDAEAMAAAKLKDEVTLSERLRQDESPINAEAMDTAKLEDEATLLDESAMNAEDEATFLERTGEPYDEQPRLDESAINAKAMDTAKLEVEDEGTLPERTMDPFHEHTSLKDNPDVRTSTSFFTPSLVYPTLQP